MNINTIRQAEAAECGLACVAICSTLLGQYLSLAELRRRFPISPRGLRLSQVMEIAGACSLSARAVRCELDELRDLTVPAILHWKLNHFVVLEKVTRQGATIIDPASGRRACSLAELSRDFTGVALEIRRSPSFRRKKQPSPLNLLSLVRFTSPVRSSLLQILFISLILQIYVLASPLYMQTAIDQAALKGDLNLLTVLAVAFGAFAAFNVLAEWMRGYASQRLSDLIGWDMASRLYHHMMRLPLPWFQRRRLADTLARFESIEPIRAVFANGIVTSVVDGALALATLFMIFAYAWPLATIVLLSVLIQCGIRLATISYTLRLSADDITAQIAEQGNRIESIRAIQSVKLMSAETQREGTWANRFAQTVKTGQARAHATLGVDAMRSLVDALTNVFVIFLGAKAVLEGGMSVGVLYAFMAYKMSFTGSVRSMFEQAVTWKMLDVHSDRIADIALTAQEQGLNVLTGPTSEFRGGLEVRDLAFQYSPQEATVFQNVSFSIQPGEFVAIAGPSGVGKSTLLKVITGLYPASSGAVLIDGIPLASWGPVALRQSIGVVMQDDELVAGSIAENIAFFAEQIDHDWAWLCLEHAGIAEEIRRMPMRLETFVGDMGSTLSGGQKQRILLARALYRRPKILILDEATSHLDVSRERAINAVLKDLSITRLVVAHRPQTLEAADRVIALTATGATAVNLPT